MLGEGGKEERLFDFASAALVESAEDLLELAFEGVGLLDARDGLE